MIVFGPSLRPAALDNERDIIALFSSERRPKRSEAALWILTRHVGREIEHEQKQKFVVRQAEVSAGQPSRWRTSDSQGHMNHRTPRLVRHRLLNKTRWCPELVEEVERRQPRI